MTTKAKDDIAVHDGARAAALIAELAVKAAEPKFLEIPTQSGDQGLPSYVPVLVDPDGQTPVSLYEAVERWRVLPREARGVAKVETLASFVDLTNRHKTADTALFGASGWPTPSLTAVIDYHTLDHKPRWGKHRVLYTFPITEELKAWIGGNGKPMEQLDFAQFLEDHAAELAAPLDAERGEYERLFKERFATPAELINLSRSLEIFVGQKIKRQERLQTGERVIEFTSEHTNNKGETVDIPGIFMVSVPAFIDGEPIRIPARLRYRAGGGSVMWSYHLYRCEHWLRERVQNDLAEAGRQTELPTYEGAPEMSA